MKGYYKQIIMDRIDKQIEKGLNKYGQTLEDNQDMTTLDRIDYLAEELVDGLQYIEHLKVQYKQNNNYRMDIIETVGMMILLTSRIKDDEVREGIIKGLRLINDSVRKMK
jgi:hypothetical protein